MFCFRFIIREKGLFEKTSTLTLTNVGTEDSGQYMCVALNPAGKVEANFTLQVIKDIKMVTRSNFAKLNSVSFADT